MALVVAGMGLVVAGVGIVRGSTAGRYLDPSLQPTDPNYAALVTPTPTLLAVTEAADGTLAGAALLSLEPGDKGGSVVVIPTRTQAPYGPDRVTLAEAYSGNPGAVAGLVQGIVETRINDTVKIDDAEWARLVEATGPVNLQLPSRTDDWAAGGVDVGSSDVGRFLAAQPAGETELNRADRQASFWQSWLGQLSSTGAELPESDKTRLGRFLKGLAAGPGNVTTLPVVAVSDTAAEEFVTSDDLLPRVLADSIPYPQSPAPGVRPRVRLLNGTGDDTVIAQMAHQLVMAGAEIAISGNAESFTESTTRIIYSDPDAEGLAESYKNVLGIGVVEAPSRHQDALPVGDADRLDVTVIVGADAPALRK